MIGKLPDEAFVLAGGMGYSTATILIGIDAISTFPIPYWPSSLAVLIFVASVLMSWPQLRENKITIRT